MTWYKKSQAGGIKLWLDDNRDPKDPEIQRLYGAQGDEIWVKTVEEAKQYIMTGGVEFISFDNDLDEIEGASNPLATEGRALANWIEEEAYHKRLNPIGWNVHSKNPEGAKAIVAAMTKADEFWGINK